MEIYRYDRAVIVFADGFMLAIADHLPFLLIRFGEFEDCVILMGYVVFRRYD